MNSKSLTDILNIQQGLLQELCSVLEHEAADMAKIQLSAMAEANRRKEELTTRIDATTPVLKKAMAVVAGEWGMKPSAPLSAIADEAEKRGSVSLARLCRSVKEGAQRVKALAGSNHDTAQRFIASVSNSLALITNVVNQSNVYGASGGYQQRKGGAVMINMEA